MPHKFSTSEPHSSPYFPASQNRSFLVLRVEMGIQRPALEVLAAHGCLSVSSALSLLPEKLEASP